MTIDFITGAPFGLNCIIRTIIGYLYGIFSENIVLSSVLVPIISIGTATLIKHVFIWIVSFFYTTITPTGIFSMKFLFEFIFNTLLSPFIFRFLKFFINSLAIHPTEDNNLNAI